MNRHYNSAEGSTYKEQTRRFPNVIKGYYCCYVPDPKYTAVLRAKQAQREKDRRAREAQQRQQDTSPSSSSSAST